MSKNYVRAIVGASICVASLLILIRCFLVPKQVTDNDLRLLYMAHKADFELLRQMFLGDAAKSRWQNFTVVPTDKVAASQEGIEAGRLEAYQELMKRLQVISLHGDKYYVHFIVRVVGWSADGRR